MTKTIRKKKKCKKAKWLSEEALQMAKKRRKVKGKGEKERYTHLNAVFQRITKRTKRQGRKGKIYHLKAEFQRTARRDKKAFLSDQCK